MVVRKMIKRQDQFAVGAAALSSNDQIPFDERGFTTKQTRQILAAGKTRFFEDILPELESYLEGTRRIVTGRSIRAYRERKLAEPQRKRSIEHLPNVKKRRSRKAKSGTAP
jgi:hypothetical protein